MVSTVCVTDRESEAEKEVLEYGRSCCINFSKRSAYSHFEILPVVICIF